MFFPHIPEWVFWVFITLAIVGLLAIVGGSIYGIIWLINHVRFV